LTWRLKRKVEGRMRFITIGALLLCLAAWAARADAQSKEKSQTQSAQKNAAGEKREMRTKQLGNGSYIRYEVMPGDDEQPPGELVVMHMEAPKVTPSEAQTAEEVQPGADARAALRSIQRRRAACEEPRMRLAARLLELRGVQVDPDVALWIERNLYFTGDGTPAVQVFPDPLFFSAMQNDSTARDLATELARCEESARR
jgi:hypothetical protein